MPRPDFVAARDDQLALFFVALFGRFFVVRGAIAEDPEAGRVIEVWLAVDAFDALLRLVGQTEAVFVEEGDERPFGRGVGVQVAQHGLVLHLV